MAACPESIRKRDIECAARNRVNPAAAAVAAALAVAALGAAPAAVSQQGITLNLSQPEYTEGEVVVMSGRVGVLVEGTPVIVQIFHGGDDLREVHQELPAEDGTYLYTILANGPLWQREGTYTVKVSYGEGSSAEARFQYSPRADAIPINDVYEVRMPDPLSSFGVGYTLVGGTVDSMSVDEQGLSLLVTVSPTSDGTLRLELPRVSIDARSGGGSSGVGGCDGPDDSYIVRVSGVQVQHRQLESTPTHRTIEADFERGDREIEVIGTCVVPEFGAAAAVLAASALPAAGARLRTRTLRAAARRAAALLRRA